MLHPRRAVVAYTAGQCFCFGLRRDQDWQDAARCVCRLAVILCSTVLGIGLCGLRFACPRNVKAPYIGCLHACTCVSFPGTHRRARLLLLPSLFYSSTVPLSSSDIFTDSFAGMSCNSSRSTQAAEALICRYVPCVRSVSSLPSPICHLRSPFPPLCAPPLIPCLRSESVGYAKAVSVHRRCSACMRVSGALVRWCECRDAGPGYAKAGRVSIARRWPRGMLRVAGGAERVCASQPAVCLTT
ncbi:hypothetical protein DFH06DRAFT_1239821 [Mycena polygramma]|nr:hypothetical protein DFH06DRAFT_1239821 [Mycena polygramma]